MIAKDNVTIGIEWRFGPDWPGQRCGAKTRRGTECLRPANENNGRCRLHGRASTGLRTADGRARISAANLRHGKFTKNKLENRLAVRRPSRYLSVSSWFEVFAIAKDQQQFIGYVTLFYFRATG